MINFIKNLFSSGKAEKETEEGEIAKLFYLMNYIKSWR